MLGDGGPRNVETARDVANRELLARDEAEDLAASRFAECGKCVDLPSVSLSLPKVNASRSGRRHRFRTESRPNRQFTAHPAGRSLCLSQTLEVTEMAAVTQDLAQLPARHWAARPLPEPPRSHRMSKSAPPQHDRIGLLLEDWMRELTVGNTLDGE
jgi:hypothetical protein